MFRHLTIAALRNMAANRLQSAIAIIGLSVGIAAALLMGLVVRNQMTFDHFIPGNDRTYLVASLFPSTDASAPTGDYSEYTHRDTAALLKLNVPEIESVTRLMLPPENVFDIPAATLKHGEVGGDEIIYWADPNVFDVLPLPVVKGDLKKALSRPDGIVLPRATARKYFGRDDVVGQVIQVDGHPMTVRAVIADLPANGTSLKTGIFRLGPCVLLALCHRRCRHKPRKLADVGHDLCAPQTRRFARRC